MKETIKNCYCDVLSEHNNQKVLGANTYEFVVMVQNESGSGYYQKPVSIDLCPACRAKYASNLYLTYGPRGKIIYTFET